MRRRAIATSKQELQETVLDLLKGILKLGVEDFSSKTTELPVAIQDPEEQAETFLELVVAAIGSKVHGDALNGDPGRLGIGIVGEIRKRPIR